ncbi:MAG: cytochrome c oxidase subunit II [Acidimicrobiia bacterium]
MGRFHQRISRIVVLVGATLVLGACQLAGSEEKPLTTFDPAGPFAEQIDGLFWLVFWIAAAIFVLVEGAVLFAVFRFRDKKGAKEAKQIHGNPKLEVLWTVIPALILAGIAVPTVSGVFDLTECDPSAIEIEVIGHQWWFEYRYPDAEFNTANVMVIPTGQEICAQMTSEDVLHNFWVPSLNGKRYLIPGQTTELRLQADEPGEYWGHCAEFCGLSHSLMRARVLAVSPAEYDVWLEEQKLAAPLPQEGTPEFDGFQVFLNKGCTQCHGVRFDDDSASNIIATDAFNGPDLTHFASRGFFAGATLPEEGEDFESSLKRWLADPPQVKPGSFMPNLALTEQEIDQLIVWLESNK